MIEDVVTQALPRQDAANEAVFNGEAGPYIDMWSRDKPVSLFGAWGPCKTAWPELERTFRWVGSRFGDGSMTSTVEVAYAGTDVADTVGNEQGRVAIDGGPVREVRIRVTPLAFSTFRELMVD